MGMGSYWNEKEILLFTELWQKQPTREHMVEALNAHPAFSDNWKTTNVTYVRNWINRKLKSRGYSNLIRLDDKPVHKHINWHTVANILIKA